MFEPILAILRCPDCAGSPLHDDNGSVACGACGSVHSIRAGVLDLIGDDASETITPFQRIMQTPLIVSIYERFWRRAGYHVASSRSFDEEIRTVMGLQAGTDNGLVLDLACGTGVFTRPLARQSGGIVVGLDLSWPMLRFARRSIDRAGIQNVFLVRGSAARLPFLTAAFTRVNCCGALHLFDRPDDAIREIRRVLCPGGYLSVQTTIRPDHSALTTGILERLIRFGFFDEAELRAKLTRQDLRILTSERHKISFTFQARCEPSDLADLTPSG